MPRPAGWTPTTPIDDVNLNANTKDVIGDLNSLNKIHFPNTNLVSAINAVPSMMNKIFYVDAQNGDDTTGDGSQTAPFQTIKKAVDSVPVGGAGEIVLIGYGSTTTYDISNDIEITNKIIKLRGDTTNGRAVIKQLAYLNNNYTAGYSFVLSGSSLFSYGGIDYITGVKDAGATSDTSTFSFGLIRGATITEGKGNIGFTVSVFGANIEINHLSFITSGNVGWFTNLCVSIHGGYTTWTFNDVGNVIGVTTSTMCIAWSSVFSYTDNANRSISTQADVISGIVRDANGVPRNILSNLIL